MVTREPLLIGTGDHRSRRTVQALVPEELWVTLQHRLLDEGLTVRQVVIAGVLAFVRGEIRIDPKTGRYMIEPADDTDVVLDDRVVRLEELFPGGPAPAPPRPSVDGDTPWDRRTDERGVRILTLKHLTKRCEEILGRPVSRQLVSQALRRHHPRPKGTRYEWTEDDPKFEEIAQHLTEGGGLRETLEYRLSRIAKEFPK